MAGSVSCRQLGPLFCVVTSAGSIVQCNTQFGTLPIDVTQDSQGRLYVSEYGYTGVDIIDSSSIATRQQVPVSNMQTGGWFLYYDKIRDRLFIGEVGATNYRLFVLGK